VRATQQASTIGGNGLSEAAGATPTSELANIPRIRIAAKHLDFFRIYRYDFLLSFRELDRPGNGETPQSTR
jgi:hypothetical protein